MTPEDAVKSCDFWTSNMEETIAWGCTSNGEAGEVLGGTEFKWEAHSNPTRLGWAVSLPRWVRNPEADIPPRVENPLYRLAVGS